MIKLDQACTVNIRGQLSQIDLAERFDQNNKKMGIVAEEM